MTRISIAMATYNGERFLREQLDSLAGQTLLPLELVVGDDGSSDGTIPILDEFAKTAPFPVRVHHNPQRLGYGENFLQSAARCSGDWIAFCDQDDLWLPDKLECCERAIRHAPPDLQLVVHHAFIADEHGSHDGATAHDLPVGTFSALTLPGTWFAAGFTQVFRAELVRQVPLWPRAEIPHDENREMPQVARYPHDSWVPLLANTLGTILVIKQPLALYRRHGGTITDIVHQPLLARAKSAAASHAGEYARLSGWYGETARVLDELADLNVAPNIAEKLRSAARLFRQESADLGQRSALHAASTFPDRFRRLSALVRSGAYTRRWTMTPKSLVKDILRAALPISNRASAGRAS